MKQPLAGKSPEISRSDFFQDVHDVVRLIPPGRVTSYGAIAAYLGAKAGARTVGWAMMAGHGVAGLACHRVVNRVGLLTGKQHFEDPDAMQRALEAEGVLVENNQITDFAARFWDPAQELA
ncbi:MAG: MGMT family protein [Hymenobacteraceae bacterium]|nr:MGMT family protein [Hymenobacteraceae bacterium]